LLYHLEGQLLCRTCARLWYAAQRVSATARKFLAMRRLDSASLNLQLATGRTVTVLLAWARCGIAGNRLRGRGRRSPVHSFAVWERRPDFSRRAHCSHRFSLAQNMNKVIGNTREHYRFAVLDAWLPRRWR